MHLDWIISVVIFVIFVVWAFTYYTGFFSPQTDPMVKTADYVTDSVMDFLLVDVYEIPVRYNSSDETNNSVLYFNFTWLFGKNSTKVFSDGTSLPCNITGDSLYWLTNLTNLTLNYFTVRFSDQNVNPNCNSTFTIENETQVIPWAQEKSKMVSQEKINNMTNTSYSSFKDALGVDRDFRVELNITNSITSYGLLPPNATNVYVRQRWSKIEESNALVDVRVLVW